MLGWVILALLIIFLGWAWLRTRKRTSGSPAYESREQGGNRQSGGGIHNDLDPPGR